VTVFAVITKVPSKGVPGNLALSDEIFVQTEPPSEKNEFEGKHKPLQEVIGVAVLMLRKPVFHLGEILILDANGREFGYPGRKPSKWLVTYEEFKTVQEAIVRAGEVLALP
jgi:hypothetical protein